MPQKEPTAARRRGCVTEITAAQVVEELPAITSVGDEDNFNEDLFVCANGFEDRALAISNFFCSLPRAKQPEIALALIGAYETNREDNQRNFAALCSNFHALQVPVQTFQCDEPKRVFEILQGRLSKISEQKGGAALDVSFDMSAASNRVIMSVMGALLQSDYQIRLRVLYSEPKSYVPSHEEYINDPDKLIREALGTCDGVPIHESGVGTVAPNPLYPGVACEGGNHLIVIPSHHTERMVSILESMLESNADVSPFSSVTWLLGNPPTKNQWRKTFQIQVLRAASEQMGKPEFAKQLDLPDDEIDATSTFDYRETVTKIIELVDARLGHRITIAPMGSKMQALGAALALSVRNECAVTHASPKRFNPARYSDGFGDLWQIYFSNLTETRKKLSNIGSLMLQHQELSAQSL